MSTLNYFIEANAGVIIFYAIYHLLLGKETDFKIQRLSLISGLAISIALPLATITFATAATNTPVLAAVLPEIILTASRPGASGSIFQGWDIFSIGVATYFIGMIVVLVPIAVQVYRLTFIYRNSNKGQQGEFHIVETPQSLPSFSFFRTIVIGQCDSLTAEEKKMVVLHEQSHGRLLHSLDVLFITAITIAFWFNPIVWWYRRTLLRVHEYQVDNIVSRAESSDRYSLLLAKTALVDNGVLLAHHFNKSFILKRIQMINQLKNSTKTWKLATMLFIALGYAVTVACTDRVSESNSISTTGDATPTDVVSRLSELKTMYPETSFEAKKLEGNLPEGPVEFLSSSPETGSWIIIKQGGASGEPLTVVDETATPLGGIEDFYDQIAGVLVYPKQARQMGIEGKVFIEFVVNADGQPTEYKVLKGIGAGCDVSALNAITSVKGSWKPAMHGTKPVNQRMVLPITFKLG